MKTKLKLAINGFGRIGRAVCKLALNQGIHVVAINDLTDTKTLAHLFKYDSIHGVYPGDVTATDDSILINNTPIRVYAEREPKRLPWRSHDIDIAIESTGLFTKARTPGYLDHLEAGAKKVILTVPAKDDITTVVLGVNNHVIRPDITAYSNASCTTNCLAPVVKVLHDTFGLDHGLINTVHAYTNDQRILDAPHSDLRRARAAAESIIPTTTGAAKAVGLVIPSLAGKLDGLAMRVPVKNGSVVDLTAVLSKSASKEAIEQAFQAASEAYAGILDYTLDPIVSCDIIGNPHSSIVDGLCTMTIGPKTVKVVAWYDNEWGYSNRVVDLVHAIQAA